MKTKIKTIIKALAAEYPLSLRYLQVDHSSNTGYARVEVRITINPRCLEYSISRSGKRRRSSLHHRPYSGKYLLSS